MRARGPLLLAGCLLALGAFGVPGAADEGGSASEARRQRLGRAKELARAHAKAEADAAAERAKALADLGITGVAALGTHGDAGRCVDIAFIGDGFAAADQAAWVAYVEEMRNNFETPPFDVHAAHVNFHRIDLVSPVSGIKLDDNAVETPLGGEVNPFVGGKLLRVDTRKVIQTVRAALPQADYIIAVLNTFEKFRGSANTGLIVKLSTAKAHRRSIVVHEFGHNYVNLLDEYVDPKQSGNRAPPAVIDRSINATLESNAYLARWHHWNVPEAVFRGKTRGKPVRWESNVGCFEGGATFPDGVYRAEENCHMQRGRGKQFCRVCTEGMELGTWRFFEPIERVEPLADRLALGLGDKLEFAVLPVAVTDAAESLRVAWYLDGKRIPAKRGKSSGGKGKPLRFFLPLKGRDVGLGAHHLTATLDVVTPRVHMDRGRLGASFTWTLEVSAKGPRLDVPARRVALAGEPLTLEARAPDGAADGAWSLANAPEGATYDGATGAFAWTPTEAQVGGHLLLFRRAGAPAGEAPAKVAVTVKPTAKRGNKPPKFLWVAPPKTREGERLAFTLEAYDADGDRLAYDAADLPRGATLDPATGAFDWRVGLTQRGTHELAFTVTDGQKTAKLALPVHVEGAALFRGMFSGGQIRIADDKPPSFDDAVDWMLVGLHHPEPRIRREQVGRLATAPRVARLAESLRLLRFPEGDIAAEARAWIDAEVTAAAGAEDAAGRTWPVDLLLDTLPARVWQFVERPETLAAIARWSKALGEAKGLTAPQRKAFAAVGKDVEVIEAYNAWRRAQPPMPPVTDKKYK